MKQEEHYFFHLRIANRVLNGGNHIFWSTAQLTDLAFDKPIITVRALRCIECTFTFTTVALPDFFTVTIIILPLPFAVGAINIRVTSVAVRSCYVSVFAFCAAI